MRELVTMWANTRMVVLAALTAALYAALLIPFKPIPIIPGFTELRPAVAVPLVFGYLFGPAGAWGSGLGNVIGDFFGGTLSLGSLFGFVGNFLFALTPYKLLAPVPAGAATPAARPWRHAALFAAAAVPASAACAATIGWGVDLLGLVPFAALGSVIFANNLLVGLTLGPVLLRLVAPRVAAWHLLWTDVMEVSPRGAGRRRLGAALIWAGAVGALVAGLAISTGWGDGELFRFGVGATSSGVAAGVPPLLLLFLLGILLA
ncbi:MAG TPA: QueT transporter family protein [Candidatus Methanoperedens sp.]|nr:QueT transporter family protein [Candidatus Methanoperedens sp.]